jgi:hypothetical protein
MPRQIVIDFDLPTDARVRNDLIHRIRNFGEELHRACVTGTAASVSLEEVDKATNQLRVAVRSARRTRQIAGAIEKLLDRHNLGGVSRLSQVKPST